MRILYLCTFYHRALLFRQQMDALIERGHEVYAFSTAEYGEGIKEKFKPVMDDKVKHYECWNKYDRLLFFPRQWKIERRLKQAYRIEDFDLMHAHLMLSTGYTALRMKKKYGTKYVVSVRSTDLTGFIKIPCFKSMARKILTNASGIMFLSHVHKRSLMKILGEEFFLTVEDKCSVIGNCVESFWEDNVYHGRTFDCQSGSLKVLTVAKIRPVKNITKAAETVEELNQRGYKTQLTVIGENQDDEEYQRIKKYPNVTIRPFMTKEQLIDEYRNHDIFLLPSRGETFGRVYVEAMTQGLPVIYTRNQGFDGNYEDGEVGYAVPFDNPVYMADSIEKILKNYETISKNCIIHSMDFNESSIIDLQEKFYVKALHSDS